MTRKAEILILADRDPRSLRPLTEETPPALLPLAGKPLIAHLIEALSTCVTADVTIVVAPGDVRTPAWFAEHGFPRLNIVVTNKAATVLDRDMLVFRGDMVIAPFAIQAFVKHHGAPESGRVRDPKNGAWRLLAGDLTPTWREVAMENNQAEYMLPSMDAYWKMCLSANRGELLGFQPAGWIGADGIRAGVNSYVLTRRAPGANIHVGDNAFVDKLVSLGNDVVIGDRAFIARGVVLANAIVMPGTYVGPGLELEDVIVTGGWLCRMDTGSIIRVSDNTVLGSLAA